MSDDRRGRQMVWNLPPGLTTTRCPECLGQGSVVVERSYATREEVGTLRVPACCAGCGGGGAFPGMQPPV